MQKSKQINKPIYAHWRDVGVPGSLVYVYAATVWSLLHRLTGSCAGLTAASLMFAGAVLQPTSPSTFLHRRYAVFFPVFAVPVIKI